MQLPCGAAGRNSGLIAKTPSVSRVLVTTFGHLVEGALNRAVPFTSCWAASPPLALPVASIFCVLVATFGHFVEGALRWDDPFTSCRATSAPLGLTRASGARTPVATFGPLVEGARNRAVPFTSCCKTSCGFGVATFCKFLGSVLAAAFQKKGLWGLVADFGLRDASAVGLEGVFLGLMTASPLGWKGTILGLMTVLGLRGASALGWKGIFLGLVTAFGLRTASALSCGGIRGGSLVGLLACGDMAGRIRPGEGGAWRGALPAADVGNRLMEDAPPNLAIRDATFGEGACFAE